MTISISNGSFSYDGKKEIFRNLNFLLKKGEILSVLGPNGCGKTTLLKILLEIHHLSGGVMKVDNQPCRHGRNGNQHFGYVPQSTGVPVAYSVFQMVLLGRSRFIGTFSRPSPGDYQKVEEILKMVNISHLAVRSFASLSGGERQLVLIARALATEARVLVFDEPTSSLDLVNQHYTVELMRVLSHEKGYSIIFSTHDPTHALHISDNTILINREGTSLFGLTKEMITEKHMKLLFGVETRILDLSLGEGMVSRGVMPILPPFKPRAVNS